ncbi:MAG: DUF2228 domain-containing protein [Nannocystaceae bacterium]
MKPADPGPAGPAELALTLAEERWSTLFPVEDEGATLASWRPPCLVDGIGLVAAVQLFARETYRGPSADLVIVPWERLGDAAVELDTLAAILDGARARGLASALEAPLAATLALEEVRYREGMFEGPRAEGRRDDALVVTRGRLAGARARMREVYGLLLPATLATFAAFWRSLDPLERAGAEHLGRSPGGIMIWFEDGGLARRTRDGLDARLECRFRCDPPELVTVMWGDSDGLHYGLWYDDPADPPTGVAHNYARDSAETWRDEEPTPLRVLLAQAQAQIDDPYRDEPAPLSLFAVRDALLRFEAADRRALAEDPPADRWLDAPRIPTLGTFGPALPPEAGTIRVGDPHERLPIWRTQPQRTAKWIASALRECAEGRPAAALTFGLDLHWLDREEDREAALELMVAAYEALGRRAHALTIKAHYRHRDLRSVGVFLPPEQDQGDDTAP